MMNNLCLEKNQTEIDIQPIRPNDIDIGQQN